MQFGRFPITNESNGGSKSKTGIRNHKEQRNGQTTTENSSII